MNSAELRLPTNLSLEEREQRVRQALGTFGLEDHSGDLVEKLSGGQRKRLSIALEYISSPSLFILDEPDSGLDGIMARELMQNLRIIASEGRIVMVITHTPDRVANLFDRVIVLAKDSGDGKSDGTGRLAFYGGIQEAKEFFETSSMEGIVRRVNSVSEGGEGRSDEFIAKYAQLRDSMDEDSALEILTGSESDKSRTESGTGIQGSLGADTDTDKEKKPVSGKLPVYAGRVGQISIYLGKLFRLFVYEKQWKIMIMSVVIAIVVSPVVTPACFITMEGTLQCSLVFACVCIWNGFFNSVQSICRERDIIKREHRAGLHMSSYICAHAIYQAIICFLQLIVCMLVYWAAGLKLTGPGIVTPWFFTDVFITFYLITFAADMLAILLSAIVHTTTTAMTAVPFLLIVQLVFAGTYFRLPDIVRPLSNLTISKWGINALCSVADYNSLNGVSFWNAVYRLRKDETFKPLFDTYINGNEEIKETLLKIGNRVQQDPSFMCTVQNVVKDWGILILVAVVCILVSVLVLQFIDKDER
jgi:ABC-type multidrug transport system ATPase subunit